MDLQFLFIGLCSLASGVPMLVIPRKKRLAAEKNLSTRKVQLAAGASEHYFEERRTLDAYPPPGTDAKWRMRGALLTGGGVALLVLSYIQ